MDYQNGKIYKLVGGGITYYGSTCSTLRQRLYQHKKMFEYCGGITTSKLLFENSDEVKIFLVEKFPCVDKMELNARERWYIENNECVNNRIPTRTKKEYREAHKEQIKEQNKQYYEENKEVRKKKDKQYYEVNKDNISKRKSEKINCECGAVIRKGDLSRHKKTTKHILLATTV
jgi:vacuolar-type H+-ATPase subunit H